MKSIPCVCCGTRIYSSFDKQSITDETVDNISFSNGMACKIAYGYGCKLDGNMYIIGLCENCTIDKVTDHKLIFIGSYIP